MKKNLTLISLMLGVMLLVTIAGVSAVTFGPTGPNYAQCTTTSGGYNVCTTAVRYDDGNVATMEGEEEIQGRWNWNTVNIPSNAVINDVKVYVQGRETDPNVDANIQLWSANTQESLTSYQSFPYNEWTVLTFEDSDLTEYVQDRISSVEDVEVEVDFEDGGYSRGSNAVQIDYVWLEIEYTLPYCNLVVDEPGTQEIWFDSEAVPITWHLEGNACTPIDYFYISYKKDGNCADLEHGWYNLTWGANGEFGNPYSWTWNRPMESGQYCVKVKVTSNGARDASGVFNVDLAKPVVHLESVGTPQYGDCSEGEGTCYVNQSTDITITCTDDNPVAAWQSGVDYIKYRINGGSNVTVDGDEATFSFTEDSNHNLEYWCYDNVGKEAIHKTKDFVVESVAPIITKTVGEPKVSGCDALWEACDWYVNTDTKICLSAVDPEPHPSNNVEISCEYSWWATDFRADPSGHVEVELDENGCFSYGEGSYHELHCTAADALGNTADLYEADIVDDLAPYTNARFIGPYYPDENSEWD